MFARSTLRPDRATINSRGEKEDTWFIRKTTWLQNYHVVKHGFLFRYYFDVEQKECKKFLYGGCAGNENNFVTKVKPKIRCFYKNFAFTALRSADEFSNISSKSWALLRICARKRAAKTKMTKT